jgi:hypothetical protein
MNMINFLLAAVTWNAIAETPAQQGELEVVSMATLTSADENTKPFITARREGGAYLAWARKVGERTAVLCATSRDGERFDQPVQVSTAGSAINLATEGKANPRCHGVL